MVGEYPVIIIKISFQKGPLLRIKSYNQSQDHNKIQKTNISNTL